MVIMSQRSIFLFAAPILIYFLSYINYSSNPINVRNIVNYNSENVTSTFLIKQLNITWCKVPRMRSPPLEEPVGLASYCGSGNTWLRYLLQQATGIVTGSIYYDAELISNGLFDYIQNGSALVVKTHAVPSQCIDFSSVILLIRNPRDAILADFNRWKAGHHGMALKSDFQKDDWKIHFSEALKDWEKFYNVYLSEFLEPMYIVSYKSLVRDTRNTLEGILQFLNYSVTVEDMNCAISNKDRWPRRKKRTDFDPFTEDMYRLINIVKNRVYKNMLKYINRIKNTRISYNQI